MNPRRPAEHIAEDEADKERARDAERLCRYDFLTRPDHEERCICDPPCSRDYDPQPYRKTVNLLTYAVTSSRQLALPAGDAMYRGTGIGALYGGPMDEHQAASLAGWNIKPGSAPE